MSYERIGFLNGRNDFRLFLGSRRERKRLEVVHFKVAELLQASTENSAENEADQIMGTVFFLLHKYWVC